MGHRTHTSASYWNVVSSVSSGTALDSSSALNLTLSPFVTSLQVLSSGESGVPLDTSSSHRFRKSISSLSTSRIWCALRCTINICPVFFGLLKLFLRVFLLGLVLDFCMALIDIQLINCMYVTTVSICHISRPCLNKSTYAPPVGVASTPHADLDVWWRAPRAWSGGSSCASWCT